MFSHINKNNQSAMVNIEKKDVTLRRARACAIVALPEIIIRHFDESQQEIPSKKGPVFQTAILAGSMAVKKTSELIPLCHPLPVESCDISIRVLDTKKVEISCSVSAVYKTGVEMEALTGASIAALTVYDMCKALSHDIIIEKIEVVSKKGGKHDFVRESDK